MSIPSQGGESGKSRGHAQGRIADWVASENRGSGGVFTVVERGKKTHRIGAGGHWKPLEPSKAKKGKDSKPRMKSRIDCETVTLSSEGEQKFDLYLSAIEERSLGVASKQLPFLCESRV